MTASGLPTREGVDPAKSSLTLAVRKDAAAIALSVSDETFDRYVRPSLPVVRVGSVRVYPVALLERWLIEHAVSPADELEEALR
jgi:hypothetical protein